MAQTKLETTKYNGIFSSYMCYVRRTTRCWNDTTHYKYSNFRFWSARFLVSTCKTTCKGGLILLLSSCVVNPTACELRPSVKTDNYILTTTDNLQLSSHYLIFCVNCLIGDLK